jgi:predicted transcriptional regulator of viral defense system
MDYETAKKNIARLEKKGILRRVVRGVYDKPKYSQIRFKDSEDLYVLVYEIKVKYNYR